MLTRDPSGSDEHPDASAPDFAEVRAACYEEARLHYRYLWDSLDSHERSTVLRVARNRPMPDALKHVLGELESRHYVEHDGGAPTTVRHLCSSEFVKAEGGKEEKSSRWEKLSGGR